MQVETLLPLGKVDPGLRAAPAPLDIFSFSEDVQRLEALGFDGYVVEETKDDPYMLMALAAQATTTLKLTTGIALAFPRSPTVTALSAWTAQKLSEGRFTLGLGTQVKGHIERRFGVPWSAPGPWMRDYVGAVRAVWHSWQTGDRLQYSSKHYNLSLMVPLFDPGPVDQPDIPIHLAAVNAYMCQVAGEVADGMRPHPVCTPDYIRQVMLPAARQGAAASGRDMNDFKVAMKPLVCTAPDEATLAQRVEDVRARVAFYASTPAYQAAFDVLGHTDLALTLQKLSKAQQWDQMPGLIDDQVLRQYATIGTFEDIADKILGRYGGLVDSIEFSIAPNSKDEENQLKQIIKTLQREND